MMNKQEKRKSVILYTVFVFYILLLIKMLFLSRVPLFELFDGGREWRRSVNLVPFKTILLYLNARHFDFGNLVGNAGLLMPLGVYLPLFRKKKGVLPYIFFLLIVSVSVELIQWIFGLGAMDIDDVILNFLGGVTGVFFYRLLQRTLRDEKKVRFIVTVFSLLGLPVIFYLLFVMKMRF